MQREGCDRRRKVLQAITRIDKEEIESKLNQYRTAVNEIFGIRENISSFGESIVNQKVTNTCSLAIPPISKLIGNPVTNRRPQSDRPIYNRVFLDKPEHA